MKHFEPKTRWLRVVLDYILREITYESDRLPAISGLAKEIHLQTKMVYRAGIWIEDLYRALIWTAVGAGQHPSTFIAPPWSWASLGRSTDSTHLTSLYGTSDFLFEEDFELRSTLIDCEVIPLHQDTYSELVWGHLDLQAPWISATELLGDQKPHLNSSWNDIYKSYDLLEHNESRLEFEGQIICDFDVLPRDRDLSDTAFHEISFLQILSTILGEFEVARVLMLTPTEQGGVFRRVGIVEVPLMGEMRNGWVSKCVRII